MRAHRILWIAITIFSLALIVRIIPGPRTIDDAYITFRYARNLLAGDGFVFNPGERVLGTTTPLFTLTLASLALFFGGAQAPFPILAVAVATVADATSCVLLLLVGRKIGSEWAGVGAAAAWAIAPFSVTFAIGGLETSMYVLLLLSISYFYLDHRYALSAFCSALALLTRPDALLLILPLIIDRAISVRAHGAQRLSLKEIASFSMPLLLWGLFAWAYFGSPFPQSVVAKSSAYRVPEFTALVRFLQHYATPFLEHLTFGLQWIGLGLFLYPFLSLVGFYYAITKAKASWPFLVYPWVYFAVFAIANPLVFRWYLTPPLPFYFLAILLGADRIIQHLWKGLMKRNQRVYRVLPLISFVLMVLSPFLLQLNGWMLLPEHGQARPAPEMAWIELELLYKDVAAQLQDDSHSTLAAGDVGVLGYFTNLKILDLVGLNSPETSVYFPLEDSQYGDFVYAVPTELVLDKLPDYIVILEIYGRESLLKESAFLNRYDLVRVLPTDIYDSNGLLVYMLKK